MERAVIGSIFDPKRWGLPEEGVQSLGGRLRSFWQRFCRCFRTKTRDTSEYAYRYLGRQLRMEGKRNFANIGRTTCVPEQNMHHFMSNSPWSAQEMMRQMQAEVAATNDLREGSVLILDESADEKSGDNSAGAGRQYNGRMSKVDMS